MLYDTGEQEYVRLEGEGAPQHRWLTPPTKPEPTAAAAGKKGGGGGSGGGGGKAGAGAGKGGGGKGKGGGVQKKRARKPKASKLQQPDAVKSADATL